MRHRKAGRKLGRTTSHKNAMLRNMVTSFLKDEKIVTTDAKAKELRSVAEKMITLGKRGNLHARRQALSFIRDKKIAKKVFEEISPRFSERAGGYTRIVKIGNREGDNAPVSLIELVARAEEKPKKGKGKEKAKPESKTKAAAKTKKAAKPKAEAKEKKAEAKPKSKAKAKTEEKEKTQPATKPKAEAKPKTEEKKEA